MYVYVCVFLMYGQKDAEAIVCCVLPGASPCQERQQYPRGVRTLAKLSVVLLAYTPTGLHDSAQHTVM